MKKLPKLAHSWQGYEQQVIPKNAPPVQFQETKRAFYAGAWALLGIMKRIGDDMSEEQGADALDKLEQEIQDFINKIGKGN